MAMTARVTNIARSDTALTVEFMFEDLARGFSQPRVITFQNNETLTQMRDAVISMGQMYIRALDAEAAAKAGASPLRVGATINIPSP